MLFRSYISPISPQATETWRIARYLPFTFPISPQATETWRIARLQYAGNAMRHKRRDPPRSPETGGSSPTSRRGLDSGDGPAPPDIATELSAVYFSYQPDPSALAEEEAALSAEQEAANEMELAQRARMDEMRERQRRRQEQSELDAVMGL